MENGHVYGHVHGRVCDQMYDCVNGDRVHCDCEAHEPLVFAHALSLERGFRDLDFHGRDAHDRDVHGREVCGREHGEYDPNVDGYGLEGYGGYVREAGIDSAEVDKKLMARARTFVRPVQVSKIYRPHLRGVSELFTYERVWRMSWQRTPLRRRRIR